ncbi:hypothetical protein A0J48_024390 [Sphaerospermopsis aphanizomenoides BCCUSP55]|uniref:hypothetical protein n=1 Tax=Sphaerospermopsis aphanizomenoides TaxID=459663 RepID=UPI001903FF92|nr:hypothetical protein [Sphaerospermopsis aphanizomenoides]MBK1990622.1 hypothetical protein [Sphaerospermopsis aphanizomenoides BCCUSP55]
MNSTELRQKIEQNLLTIFPENLKLIDEFVEFIKYKQENKQETNLAEPTNYRPASGRSILRHAGTWLGDDLEDCLQVVLETRGKVKINNRINPFE